MVSVKDYGQAKTLKTMSMSQGKTEMRLSESLSKFKTLFLDTAPSFITSTPILNLVHWREK